MFDFDGMSWQPDVKLTGSMPLGIGPWFGATIDLDARAMVMCIGAPFDYAAGPESGATYVFRRQDEWAEASKFTASDTDASDHFGSVGLDGDVAIIGAGGNNSSGKVYFFARMSGTDCNGNGEPDGCDIVEGSSIDANGNDVPDECEIPGDVTGDGVVDVLDLVALILAWGPCADACPPACPGDVDGDCTVGVEDLTVIVESWGTGP
jgi:hypothetical protein